MIYGSRFKTLGKTAFINSSVPQEQTRLSSLLIIQIHICQIYENTKAKIKWAELANYELSSMEFM